MEPVPTTRAWVELGERAIGLVGYRLGVMARVDSKRRRGGYGVDDALSSSETLPETQGIISGKETGGMLIPLAMSTRYRVLVEEEDRAHDAEAIDPYRSRLLFAR
jgi:hypothetical protein